MAATATPYPPSGSAQLSQVAASSPSVSSAAQEAANFRGVSPHGRLAGKVALVSGSAGGLGEGIAICLAEQGCKVIVSDLSSQQANGAKLVEKLGGKENAAFVTLDVTKEEEWEKAVNFSLDTFGRLDILVNNAGGSSGYKRMDKEDPAAFHLWLQVNITGVWNGMRAAVPAMEKVGGGSIINISSMVGLQGVRGLAGYSATKHAVVGLTKSGAMDFGYLGIRVNSIQPGVMETPGLAVLGAAGIAGLNAQGRKLPLRRLGTIRDIGNACIFFASQESSYCTGSQLLVDGGSTAGRMRDLPEDEELASA